MVHCTPGRWCEVTKETILPVGCLRRIMRGLLRGVNPCFLTKSERFMFGTGRRRRFWRLHRVRAEIYFAYLLASRNQRQKCCLIAEEDYLHFCIFIFTRVEKNERGNRKTGGEKGQLQLCQMPGIQEKADKM